MTLRRVRVPNAGSLSAHHLLLSVVFVLLVLLIASCGGGDGTSDQGETTLPVEGTALTCSQECSDRSQCGDSADRGTVVLLNFEQPGVVAVEHDLAIPAGTAVDVVEERSMTVVENSTGMEFPVLFYRVYIPERNVEAWVAGWCIINP